MANKTSEAIRKEMVSLLDNFKNELLETDLRKKVLSLIPVFSGLKELGLSLVPRAIALSARNRILAYLQKYRLTIISGDELYIVSGIHEWARRVRELRVQYGWHIVNGNTLKQMIDAGEEVNIRGGKPDELRVDKYILLSSEQDRDSAHRWNIANEIRRKKGAVRDKLLEFFKANVGKPVTGEELRYVAKDKTEWARRTRELRTEQGWPVATRNTGAPSLDIGSYILLADRQSHKHDRMIPDSVRREVLRRDANKCKKCNWSFDEWNPSDPRILELHHIRHHAKGGENQKDNLIILCTKCHDNEHRKDL